MATPIPAALSLGGGHSGGPLITPAEAERVTRVFFPLLHTAKARDDAPMLARLETWPAKADALETADVVKGGGRTGREPLSIDDIRLAVPYQAHYPAAFLAIVQTQFYSSVRGTPRGATEREYLLMLRRSAGTPWRLAVFANSLAPPLVEDHGVIAASDPAHPGFALAARESDDVHGTFVALARYYQSWWSRGHAPIPTPILPGPLSSEAGQSELAGNGQDQITSHGVRRHLVYRDWPGEHERFAFVFGRSAVSCSVLTGSDRYTAARAGGRLNQNYRRTNWGHNIPPGRYRSIDARIDDGLCVAARRGRTDVIARQTATFNWRGHDRQPILADPRGWIDLEPTVGVRLALAALLAGSALLARRRRRSHRVT